MQSFEEFIAAAEREEAKLQDEAEGHVYNLGNAILRALHNRVGALEERAGLAATAPQELVFHGDGCPGHTIGAPAGPGNDA